MNFLEENSITLFQFGVPGNKEPFVDIPEDKIRDAIQILMDKRNHPGII
jgi:tyrosine-protein phosphatase SIW14